jgi:tetratricopeptide (TPR) repeat protein
VLSAALWDRHPERRPEVYRMYDQATHLYPGDYVLQSIGGLIYQLAGRNEASLICRTAALSLRPDDNNARLRVEDGLMFLGRLTEAENAAKACVAMDPKNAEAHYNLGMVLLYLGDEPGALASVSRSLELADDPARRADLLSLRYRNGLATKADVARALDRASDLASMATYLYTLLDHRDPAQRDPELVLKTLEESAGMFAVVDWKYLVETVARIRLADWTGALAALGDHFTLPSTFVMTPGAVEFLRATVYAHVGRADAARDCYARGMVRWKELTADDAAAWERSDVMRWRREAEAALGR